ncbi:MAG: glycosyltransferase family 39 protein [Chloroflexi bacterium]|nr:glycosyltransferase family 39 protein [Chloroflexota bacterium]MCL5273828.1 glycosyltransferase family 39 protein [Chloroflexota bacterium]
MDNAAKGAVVTRNPVSARNRAGARAISLPVLLVFAAFVLRIMNITGESLWRDEVDTIRFAFAPFSEMLQNLTRNGFNGPLYLLTMRVWLNLAGVNDMALRYFSLICGVFEVAFIYVLAKRIFNRTTALFAAGIAAVAPVLIWYSGEGKMYSLQPALLLLALYALRRAIDGKPRGKELRQSQSARGPALRYIIGRVNGWWVVFIAAVSAGYYVHLLTPLFLPVAAVFFLAWWPRARHHWRSALIALAVCTVPYIPLAIWQIPIVLAGMNTGHTAYALDAVFYSLLYNWSLGLSDHLPIGVPASFTWLAILCFSGLGLTGVVAALWFSRTATKAWSRNKSVPVAQIDITANLVARTAPGILAWLVLPTLSIYLISMRAPIFEPRYVLWSAPALYLLIAYGLSRLMPRLPLVGSMLTVLLCGVSLIGLVAQIEFPIRPDIRGAAKFVAGQMQPGDIFVFQIPYTKYGFEYYLPFFTLNPTLEPAPFPGDGLRTVAGLRERIVDAPFTNGAVGMDDVAAALQPLESRSHRIWLVEAESAMWDQRGLVRAWFDANMQVAARDERRGITITLYVKP